MLRGAAKQTKQTKCIGHPVGLGELPGGEGKKHFGIGGRILSLNEVI